MGFMGGMRIGFLDSLVNLVSRIGTTGDKAISNTYALNVADKTEIDAAYRSSWLARKVIDIPPLDMTREWRNWQAEDDQIEDIEEFEKQFNIIQKTKRAITWGRLYGGGALVLGIDQGNADQPLDTERIKKGSLKFIHVMHRHELTAQDVDRDPMSETFGVPKMYQANGAQTGSVMIHPSRVIRFLGNEYPDEVNANDGWSDPYWMVLRDIVSQSDSVSAIIAALLHEAKVDVISVPNFMDMVGTVEAETKLLKRFTLAMTMKSITNTLVIDGGADGKSGEQWDRKEMNFAGLENILRLFLAVAAGAADIPATRLLGKSPDGMNATGESDLRNYYDMLSSRQELELWPSLAPLDKIMQQHIFGKIDENIYFEPAPLWQMTPSEAAEIAAKKASTSKTYNDMNVMPAEAMAKIIQNQLIEDATYPGIEAALEEFGDTPDEEPQPLLITGPPGSTPGAPPIPKRLPAPAQVTDASGRLRRLDPTNTGAIRKTWKGASSRLLKSAETRIKALIKGAEGVGLDKSHYRDLLEKTLGGQEWFGKFVVRAYRRGLDDAAAYLGSTMKLPFNEGDIQRMKGIASKVQTDMNVILDDLSSEIDNAVKTSVTVPEAIARVSERIATVGANRAHMVASVHTVGTHSRAALAHYRASGVKYVGADVELVHKHRDASIQDVDLNQFVTKGDNDVCPECEDLEGQIFDLDEAEDIIPVHPNCRCAWIPVRSERGTFNPRLRTEDATPRSLYIRRDVLNADEIISWAKNQGFSTTVPESEMHVTICYSKTAMDWMKIASDWNNDEKGRMKIKPGGARIVEALGSEGAIVLLFNSSELSWRHEAIKHAGASSDYEDYQPHVTITYEKPEGLMLDDIEPYQGEILLGPEIFEEIVNGRNKPVEK